MEVLLGHNNPTGCGTWRIEMPGPTAESGKHRSIFLMTETETETHQRRVLYFVAVAALLLFWSIGCSGRQKAVSQPVDAPLEFSRSGSQKVPDRWWKAFDDPKLNRLVGRALRSNFNLKTAWARLREARAVVDRESSFLYPHLDAFAEGQIERTGTGDGEQLRLGLVSDYEVDLWNRIESTVQAERYRAKATLADYRTAALSLSAEVVRTWYQLMEAHAQVELLTQQVKTNEKVLNLLETRFSNGQVRRADILRQRQLLESTREQKLEAESRARALEHQLTVLLGKPPQTELSYSPKELPELPPLPETGVPVTLLRRRPDVTGAYNRLRAADRDLAAAISNQFPRLTLSASASTRENSVEDLFDNWATTLAANLVAP